MSRGVACAPSRLKEALQDKAVPMGSAIGTAVKLDGKHRDEEVRLHGEASSAQSVGRGCDCVRCQRQHIPLHCPQHRCRSCIAPKMAHAPLATKVLMSQCMLLSCSQS